MQATYLDYTIARLTHPHMHVYRQYHLRFVFDLHLKCDKLPHLLDSARVYLTYSQLPAKRFHNYLREALAIFSKKSKLSKAAIEKLVL